MAAMDVDEEMDLDLGDLADSAPAQDTAGFDPRDIASGASSIEELPDEEEEDLTPEQEAARAISAQKEKERLAAINAERKAKLFEMRAMQDREETAARAKIPAGEEPSEEWLQASADRRLQYLMQQTELYAADQGATVTGKKRGKSPGAAKASGGARSRMKESVEDAAMLKAGQSEDQYASQKIEKQPKLISKKKGTMRPYQVEGLNWIMQLHDRGVSGILADEMGLGKTLQSISVIAYLREARGIKGKHIVIVPKSVLDNWMREFRVWCPVVRTLRFHGTKAERKVLRQERLDPGDFDVVVTTYEMLIREKSGFLKHSWHYIMIDEAHRIKNEKSVLSQTVRMLDSKFRLLLTGTPLQNNLKELWALLNFLLPEFFASADDFDVWFKVDGAGMEDQVVKRLHTVLRPFLLRRLKDDVEKSLLPKIETKLYIGMTEMQIFYYKKILEKDAHTLNQLGGAGRVKLLNILMQLRKCTNHPYLFQGAEIGPPYTNGPHLWENTGKMRLLDKLLIKIKENGSRVLLFCQMTRMLDILEDYMQVRGYEYCRIDGSTSGERRTTQMDEYNAPNSSKFVFMLSTRAGGLGINLQTADIVILYDSDWNPQVDLQAMDRAHRIGQKKQVRVFRFVTEGTVEEKIVERAEKKLYLDAVVIQQGRLSMTSKGKSLGKDELAAMVRFGADNVFSGGGATFTDEDVEAILAKGEERTKMQSEKFKDDMKRSLANFSLDTSEATEYNFLGAEFGGETIPEGVATNFINLPQRKRRQKTYSVADMQSMQAMGGGTKEDKVLKVKTMTMHAFQFYDSKRINELLHLEWENAVKVQQHKSKIREAKAEETRERRRGADEVPEELLESTLLKKQSKDFEFPQKLIREKERLVEEAFGTWQKADMRRYVSACERHGRKAKPAIIGDVSDATGHSEEEVRRYDKVFWKRYAEIPEWEKLLEKIQKGEDKIARRLTIENTLQEKVAKHRNPFATLTINYGSSRGKAFTEEEDRFLVCMTAQLGYGAWELLKLEIRKAWQFRFDWFLKSRNATELQRRTDTLVRLIEAESGKSDVPAKRKSGSKKQGGPAKKKGRKSESAK